MPALCTVRSKLKTQYKSPVLALPVGRSGEILTPCMMIRDDASGSAMRWCNQTSDDGDYVRSSNCKQARKTLFCETDKSCAIRLQGLPPD